MINLATEKCKSLFEGDDTYSDLEVSLQLKHLEKDIVRGRILKTKKRIDGRGLSDVRDLLNVKLEFYLEHMDQLCLLEEKHKL